MHSKSAAAVIDEESIDPEKLAYILIGVRIYWNLTKRESISIILDAWRG